MVNQVNKAAIAVYAAFICGRSVAKNAIRDLREDQRGVSGIVVSVLLILVGVMAAVVLYNALKPTVEGMITDAGNNADVLVPPDVTG